MKEYINEINKIMDNINYGFITKDNKIINDNNSKEWDNFNEYYYLQSPEELLKSKVGVCCDQVELERYLFSKYNINTKTYFIYLDDLENLPSHTFLVYQDNNKYYWYEHSWYNQKGIHEYNNLNELLLDVKNKFISDYDNSYKLYLYEYQKPKYHITCNEFYKYLETQKQINI